MKHQPERTCVGCRNVFSKDAVVRVVAGPAGILLDYREKLPGRAAYVCPQYDCIQRALHKELIGKSLRLKVRLPAIEAFIAQVQNAAEEKVRSLIVMSAKAGKLAAGYSAVRDALEKNRVLLLVYANDISEGTKDKLPTSSLRQATLFTRDELGRLLNREMVGVVGILDNGLADAIWREAERLKNLIKKGE